MPGQVFDRAVSFYDATRGLPEGVPERIRAAIRQELALDSDARLLEVGIGTGRIALPFLQAGDHYIGADLSVPMMDVLRQKLGRTPPLVKADAEQLPFATASVDLVLMVHLLHLVDDWRAVLAECRRVLRPGGAIMVAGNATGVRRANDAPGVQGTVGDQWEASLRAVGWQRQARRSSNWILDEALTVALAELGLNASRVDLVHYTGLPNTPRTALESYRNRIFSGDWHVPDDVHAAAMERLDAWFADHTAPDTPVTESNVFSAVVGRLPG